MKLSTGSSPLASGPFSRWPLLWLVSTVQTIYGLLSWLELWSRFSDTHFSFHSRRWLSGSWRALFLALGIVYGVLSATAEAIYSHAWRRGDPVSTLAGLQIARNIWPAALDVRRGPAGAALIAAPFLHPKFTQPHLREALSWDPHSQDLLSALAYTESLVGNENEARALAKKARSLLPQPKGDSALGSSLKPKETTR